MPSEPAEQVSRLLIEKRCEVYTQVAAQLIDLTEALADDDGVRCRYLLDDLRRALRTALAFLTDEVYQELERLEGLKELLPTREGQGIPTAAHDELSDRLQLLHVKLARSLQLPRLQDLEEIVGLEPRLKRRLADDGRGLEASKRRRTVEEACLRHEAEARDEIGKKQYARAVKALRAAIDLDPERAVLRNDLGVVLSLMGKTADAVREYATAVALNERLADQRTPEWSTSYFNLGTALRKLAGEAAERGDHAGWRDALGRAREAFEEYSRVTASGAKVHDARGLVAAIGEQLARRPEAMEPADEAELEA